MCSFKGISLCKYGHKLVIGSTAIRMLILVIGGQFCDIRSEIKH